MKIGLGSDSEQAPRGGGVGVSVRIIPCELGRLRDLTYFTVSPPDEKEVKKLNKKRSAYERPPFLKGDIKFYDTRKTKKATPIATITDAYCAYAIYPQSKPLIDASTLVKVEGTIKIHSTPESTTEGFVFVMPEVHPAVSGFEMMLRWLFPVFDVFGLYGRPNKLIADTLDSRGMMFAMPKDRRYGYLEILDVATLIHSEGSQNWSEKEWRKQLKDATSRRMTNDISRQPSRIGSRRGHRISLPSRNGTLRFDDNASVRSSPSVRHEYNHSSDAVFSTPQKTKTAPPGAAPLPSAHNHHARSVSETVEFSTPQRQHTEPLAPSRLFYEANESEFEPTPPAPTQHGTQSYRNGVRHGDLDGNNDRSSSDSDRKPFSTEQDPQELRRELRPSSPPEPVAAPPAFAHQPGDRPPTRPYQAPDLRRANSRMSSATLSQLADAGRLNDRNGAAIAGAAAAWKGQGACVDDNGQRGVIDDANDQAEGGATADQRPGVTAMVAGQAANVSSSGAPPVPAHRSPLPSPLPSPLYNPDSPPQHSPSKLLPSPTSRPDGPPRINTSKGVIRKPVPVAKVSQAPQETDTPAAESLGILYQNIDLDALDKVVARETTHSSPYEPVRHSEDSNYDDLSPDYASTRKSTDTKDSIPRPRTGVLKTVGTPDPGSQEATIGDVRYGQGDANSADTSKIPTVDFGPTPHYIPGPKSRPSTAGTMTHLTHDRTPSRSLTPQDEKRFSYGRGSPISGDVSRGHSRSPSAEDRRNKAWSPGAAVVGGRASPAGRLTPEQFVQQRAAANRASPTGYAHQRSYSSNIMNHKNTSGDLSHSRNLSLTKELPPRPLSYAASATLQSTDISSHLSAREREHVARMTGSPLISVAGNRPQSAGSGLVGAIAAREKEKKDIKDGLSSQMVQQAIAQRQQQAQVQAHHYNQQQYANWNAPQQQMGQPQWVSQTAQTYWSAPQNQGSYQQQPQSQQQQSPQAMTPQQQQRLYGGYYAGQFQGR
jgi:CCR4-NOT transcriptional complex subunit CAF120